MTAHGYSISHALPKAGAEEWCRVQVHTVSRGHTNSLEVPLQEFLQKSHMLPSLDDGFRWIHLPANNMVWAEQCVEKLGFEMPELHWPMSVRPAISERIKIPLHARRMELKSHWEETQAGHPLSTIYMSYMNWEEYGQYRSLAKVYERFQQGEAQRVDDDRGSSSRLRNELETSLAAFLQPKLRRSLHPRRTLDQFYYTSLADTKFRDRDQTISKWTGSGAKAEGATEASDDSLMIMVDQLWCWVLDDRTILTCFPSDELQYKNTTELPFTDLYTGILPFVNECQTVWDMQALIVEQTIVHLWSQWNRKSIDLLEMYRLATSKKTAYQAICLKRFHDEYGHSNEAFDHKDEMNFVLEIADIMDELRIIRSLFEKQGVIVQTLTEDAKTVFADREMSERGRARIANAQRHLASSLTVTGLIDGEAGETYKALMDLLDLKAKLASLEEARSTTKQGNAVMLFTIVTIIFLPLSFFTSYFGQNVSEITGDEANPTSWELWRIGTPITVVVIFFALLIAFHIMRPKSKIWFWKRNGKSQSSFGSLSQDVEMARRRETS